ncbi:hypothetical protein Pyn_05489 [Prunus yedoensis var. nudiflora]|uniref:Uncharacterized protein n=1 Tax=Prunus yedoensis var. nudiflora TaxID=2094558 RepID=A0A314YR86_PRUYE|nr:hypothetical protein Pyn_05489 [Prunus yedoensis var. nudiflora]
MPVFAVTPPPTAVSHTKASSTPLTPPPVAVSPTTSGESVITDTITLEVDVEMMEANAVHKEARGNITWNSRCLLLCLDGRLDATV